MLRVPSDTRAAKRECRKVDDKSRPACRQDNREAWHEARRERVRALGEARTAQWLEAPAFWRTFAKSSSS